MSVTRIKNNQIFDKTITNAKIADQTLVGTLFSPNLTLNSNVVISGNLSVMGDSTTISSTNTYVNDPLIVFNNGYTGLPSYDVGMLVNRNLNDGGNTAWIWNESNKQFEGIYTTESGGTTGSINNSGWTSLKTGNVTVVSTSTLGNLQIENNTISAIDTNGNVSLLPAGTGVVTAGSTVVPTVDASYDIGSTAATWNTVYTKTANIGGAVITTNAGNITITPPVGGSTVIANVIVSGGSTFSGNIVSGNVTITGGTINGTSIGNTTPSNATFTSIIDTGNLTANGANAAISFAPTGTGTVTINPSVAGSISNMSGSFTTLNASGATILQTVSATKVTTANAQVTGGSVSGVTIVNSPISGSTGSFTTLSASGNTTLSSTTVNGIETITDTTQSTDTTNGALVVAGGVGIAKNLNVGGNLKVTSSTLLGGITVDGTAITGANVAISSPGAVTIGALTMPQTDGAAGSFMMTDGAGNISLVSAVSAVSGNVVPLGTPTVGSLTDNNPAITSFTTATKVTDAVDKLNEILGKLVPPQPPAFPNGTLTINGLSSGLRMTNFTQTDNTTTGGKQVTAGSTVSAYRRAASYSTSTLTNVGPGESGTVDVKKNGVVAGSHVIAPTLTNNGTYSDLVISNNVDYGTVTSTALLFWNSFNAAASGTVSQGWNEVFIEDSAAGTTNTPAWYYDASAPGTPVVTGSTFAPTSEVTAMSSSVPHYTATTVWTATGTATRLSGDLYPASDTFLTGTSGGSFQTPASVTYAAASVATPLARNLYVSSGNATFSTTVNTVDATGSSTAGPSYTVNNSYATGSGSSTPGGTVLTIKVSDTTKVNENNIVVGSFGTGGSATAVRVGGLATGATPALSGISAWSSSAALPSYEATVVAGTAKQDTTNYSTGYFPVGPNLSSGRSATQYITFRIQRDAVSKFDISVTGKFSGCQVAMPGSSLDTTALPTNGWVDATAPYSGSGVPGTGTGGNGSVGATIGGALVVGSTVTQSKTITFGTESSHNSTSNYIYIRFALAAGDSITALSFVNPTH